MWSFVDTQKTSTIFGWYNFAYFPRTFRHFREDHSHSYPTCCWITAIRHRNNITGKKQSALTYRRSTLRQRVGSRREMEGEANLWICDVSHKLRYCLFSCGLELI
jgi:hypothetical protein